MDKKTNIWKQHWKLFVLVGLGAAVLAVLTFVLIWALAKAKMKRDVQVTNLTTESRVNPIGIDVEAPRFGWQMESTRDGASQTEYEISVWKASAEDAEVLLRGDESTDELKASAQSDLVWDSGVVESNLSAGIAYAGSLLEAGTSYAWQVTVTDEKGQKHTSDASLFETGLMENALSDATWIGAATADPIDLSADTCFTYSEDVEIQTFDSGIVWGYSDEDLSFYNEELGVDEASGKVTLVLRLFRKYMESERQEQDITELVPVSTVKGQMAHLTVAVNGNHVTTFVNGIRVWDTEIEQERGLQGALGFYGNRAGVSFVDNVKVRRYQPEELEKALESVSAQASEGATASAEESTSASALEAALESAGEAVYEEDFTDPLHTMYGEQYVNVTDDGRMKGDITILLTQNQYNKTGAPVLRKEVTLSGNEVAKARFYATAAGAYDARINGQAVTDTVMNPGNQVFNIRQKYQTYDVTDLARNAEDPSKIDLQVTLGHGWYNRGVGFDGIGSPWGLENAFLGKLVIEYADGSVDEIVTDPSWEVSTDGPVRVDDLWQGEVYDARLDVSEGSWTSASEITPEWFEGEIEADSMEGIRNVQEIQPLNFWEAPDGSTVYDFGQEISGVCKIVVEGEEGSSVTLRHGEWVNEENMSDRDGDVGTLYTFNLQGAQQTDRYILAGGREEEYQPSFTMHGFRYMALSTTGDVTVKSVAAVQQTSVPYADSSFESGVGSLNQLYRNIYCTGQNNLVSNPMDCNQRSERFGWTGDAQVFSATGMYLYKDAQSFYENYVQQMRDVQNPEDGSVSDLAPRSFDTDLSGRGGAVNNGWGDAMVIIPWNLYLQYGDVRALEESYDSMKAWITCLENNSENWLRPESGYGDHLCLDSLAKGCVATAWTAHSCELMSKIARITGQLEDVDRFTNDFNQYRQAWINAYVGGDGTINQNSQGAYVLGLAFGLVPDELGPAVAGKLVENIQENGHHLLSGYAAAGYVMQALSENGYTDLAYQLILDDTWPSYQYEIKNGATTIWETGRTHTENEDGTYTLGGASLNHMAKGAIGKWFIEGMAGIKVDENAPGFKHVILQPQIPTDSELLKTIGHVEASYDSVYGTITAGWKLEEDGTVTYTVTLPGNTSATVVLPDQEAHEITCGTHTFALTR